MEERNGKLSRKGEIGLWALFGIIIAIPAIILPFVWWFFEPDLTRMQLFYKFWYLYVIFIVYYIIFKWRVKIIKKK